MRNDECREDYESVERAKTGDNTRSLKGEAAHTRESWPQAQRRSSDEVKEITHLRKETKCEPMLPMHTK
jgi:hypothetical protein